MKEPSPTAGLEGNGSISTTNSVSPVFADEVTWYVAMTHNATIAPVQVANIQGSTLWARDSEDPGRWIRCPKETPVAAIFPAWEEAYTWLEQKVVTALARADEVHRHAITRLAKVRSLTKPS